MSLILLKINNAPLLFIALNASSMLQLIGLAFVLIAQHSHAPWRSVVSSYLTTNSNNDGFGSI
jgi:hypothetical protein